MMLIRFLLCRRNSNPIGLNMTVYLISSSAFLLLAIFFWKQRNLLEKKLGLDYKYKLKKRSNLFNALSFLSAFIAVIIYLMLLMNF